MISRLSCLRASSISGLKSLYCALLRKLEKLSAAFADHVIISNELWRQRLLKRSVPERKCSVFLNHVDPDIFYPRPKTRSDGKFIILFPGSFQWHQGLDIAIKAFARLRLNVPNAELHLCGGGPMQAELETLVKALGLSGSVKIYPAVSLESIADMIANADLGVVPKRADSFGDEAYSTKIMEFMSQGVPVVISRTKIDSYYFDDTTVRFFTSGDAEDMASAMLEVIHNAGLRQMLVENGYKYAELNGWRRKKNEYLELVDSLSSELFDGLSQNSEVSVGN